MSRAGSLRLGAALLALLCLVPLLSTYAATPGRAVTRFRVSTRGLPIGDVITTQQTGRENGAIRMRFESRTRVKAAFLWMGYRLSSTEKGELLNGTLVSYSHKGEENGDGIDVKGRLENGAFKFETHEAGGVRILVIPRSSYDATTMECPEARIDFSGKGKTTLRVLDVEKMEVVKREYRLVRNGNYSMGGREYPCRIIDFSDKNKSARRWIAWDGTTMVLYRQDGKSDKSSYSVRATSLTREQET